MIAYLIILRPFDNFITNVIHIYNEFLILFAFLSVLVSNSISVRADTEELLGLITIIAIFISLLITWRVFLPKIVSSVLAIVTGAPKKKKEEAESKNNDKLKMNTEVDPNKNEIAVEVATLCRIEVSKNEKASNKERKKNKDKRNNLTITN